MFKRTNVRLCGAPGLIGQHDVQEKRNQQAPCTVTDNTAVSATASLSAAHLSQCGVYAVHKDARVREKHVQGALDEHSKAAQDAREEARNADGHAGAVNHDVDKSYMCGCVGLRVLVRTSVFPWLCVGMTRLKCDALEWTPVPKAYANTTTRRHAAEIKKILG